MHGWRTRNLWIQNKAVDAYHQFPGARFSGKVGLTAEEACKVFERRTAVVTSFQSEPDARSSDNVLRFTLGR